VFCVAVLCASTATARTTTADLAKQKGLNLEKTLHADIDGDGRDDTIGACNGRDGVQLCLFAVGEKGASWKALLPPAGGKRLGRVWVEDVVGSVAGTELLVEVYDETPDEKVKRVRIYAGSPAPRELFTSVIYLPKDKGARAEWDQPDVTKYGDAKPGWFFRDRDGDGNQEIHVRRRAKVIRVKREGKSDARLLVGVNEAVFTFVGGPADGLYREQSGEHFEEFLTPLEVQGATASSTWLPKEQRAELESEAMAAAVYGEGQGNGKAVTIDYAPYVAKVADRSLDTAWIADRKGGKGEWVELTLAAPTTVRMLRIAPGCLEDQKTFSSHHVPDRFELRLGDGQRATLDLKTPAQVSGAVVAVQPVKVPGKPWAEQYLVFLNDSTPTDRVRLTIERVRSQGRTNLACLAEVAVH
jgi:hypothetical protein